MAKEIHIKRLKWTIGMILAALFFYYGINLMRQEFKLGLFLLIGWGLGYAVSRSEVGLASGFTEFFITGNRNKLNGLLLLFGLGALSAVIIHYVSYSNGALPNFRAPSNQSIIPGTRAVTPVNIGLMMGSFLFGVGLTLNQGCGLGTLRNIGLGNLRYIWTLFFLLIGTIPGHWMKYRLDQSAIHNYSIHLYFPDALGYGGTLLLILSILILLTFLTRKYELKRLKKGTYRQSKSYIFTDSSEDHLYGSRTKQLVFNVFKRDWARIITQLMVTLCLLLALTLTGETLEVTEALINPAVALFHYLGFSFNDPAFSSVLETVEEGILNNHIIRQNMGIIAGAATFALSSSKFTFSTPEDNKERLVCMISGLLMGFGTVLASGCIMGALYSGIVNLSLSGWVVFAFMSLGGYVTVKVMNGKIRTIPKIEN